jgi:xylulokinase
MKTKARSVYIGIDLGTSSVKLLALETEGWVIGEAGESYPTLGAAEGRAEQDPREWIEAIVRAMAKLAGEGLDLSKVEALGLSGQMPTLALCDEKGAMAMNAILWSDPRADAVGARMLDSWGQARHYRRTGVILDGRYIAPMFAWASENLPSSIPKRPLALSAKDYIHLWLSGAAVTDPSTASGFGLYSLEKEEWDGELCREASLDPAMLPAIAASDRVSGKLLPEAARRLNLRAGIAIVPGCADSVAGVLGMGAIETGSLCQIAGSSTVMIAVHDSFLPHPERRYLVTPLAFAGSYGLEADILSTGTSLAWLGRILGLGEAEGASELSTLAADVPAGSEGLFFFPYLAGGEQGVLWDSSLVGGLRGLSLRHGRGHIARALYEGICLEARRCIAAFEGVGLAPKGMICSGPASQDPFYMRLLANATGIECRAAAAQSASALGAAILAGIGTGAWARADLGRILGRRPGAAYSPEPAAVELYTRIFGDYLAASGQSRATGPARR